MTSILEYKSKVLTEATRWYHPGLPQHHLPGSSSTLLPLAQPTPAIPASQMFFEHARHTPATGPRPLLFNLLRALLQRAKAPVLTSFPSLLLTEAITDDPNENSRSLDFPGGPVVKILQFHCRGLVFDSWLGKFRIPRGVAKKKKKKKAIPLHYFSPRFILSLPEL